MVWAGLCLAVALVYSPVRDLGWIWDDDDYVLDNPALRSLAGLAAIWFEPGATPQYYPAVFSLLWAQFQLVGLEPGLYHATNVALHAINAVLCYQILRQMQFRAAVWVAFAFALHPMQVESVAWVTELKNVLSATCYGLAWLCLWPACIAGQEGELPKSSFHNRRYWIGCIFFVLALLSKSVTASLPAAMLVAAWYCSGKLPKRALVGLAPLFLVGALLGWNTARLERLQVGAVGEDWNYTLLDRAGIAARSILHYSSQTILPLEQIFFYPRYETEFMTPWNVGSFAICGAIACAGVVLATRGKRKKRGLLAACAFFVGSALPSLSFLNVYPHRFSFVADHFVYIPLVGLLCIVGWVMHQISELLSARFKLKPASSSIHGVSLLSLYALFTYLYIPVFTNQITLWEDTLSKNPDSVAAMQNLGLAYIASNRNEDALEVLQTASEYEFDQYQTYNSLGLVLGSMGRLEEAEQALEKSIELNPKNPRPRINLGNLTRARFFQSTDESERQVLRAKAMEHYQAAWESRPNNLAAFALATMAYEVHELEQAIRWFQAAVEQEPSDIDGPR